MGIIGGQITQGAKKKPNHEKYFRKNDFFSLINILSLSTFPTVGTPLRVGEFFRYMLI